jgi:DNA-binding HxlR family transcriptional regulator
MGKTPTLSEASPREPAAARAPTSQRPQPTEVCPHYHAAIELIGKRWSGAILGALADGPLRFAEVIRCVPGLSDRLLSERLRELEANGLVERVVEDEAPVKVVYSLTELGAQLAPILLDLRRWAYDWKKAG